MQNQDYLKAMQKKEYLKTGITGLDQLLMKGIPKGAAILIEGGPGSGKTMLALQLACNFAKDGKKTLYMSFEEPETNLICHMIEDLGQNPKDLLSKDLLRVKRFSALDIARSVEALLSEAKNELLIDVHPILIPEDYNPEIVIFDSLTAISSAFSGEKYRFRIYMEQLFRYLEKNNINSFLIRETSRPSHIGLPIAMADEAVSFLSDGIIVIYNVFHQIGQRERAIEILKMRGADITQKIVKMEIIDKKGVFVHPNIQPTTKEKYTLT
ncbi:MAG: gas vesicle protein GvpD, partial [archaeon]|nr:gas vesicle protein GvpD [archaeon]